VEASAWQLIQPAGTNYLGNAGAHSAGMGNEFRPAGYVGTFTSRRGVRLASIRDGLSNTILIGENIGAIEARQRTYFHAWMFGGLARGRGGLAWLDNFDPTNPDILLFGDSQSSNPGSFGSMHPAGVNFALADGSVQFLNRIIHFQSLYDLCGASDGNVVSFDGLQ
jgi:prepilin-type processing-associated H-X9-DG protein